MAPNLASSQHDLIHDMIVDKKLNTGQIADLAECSECLIKAIRSNLNYFGRLMFNQYKNSILLINRFYSLA
jgi:hypothetical protein